MPKGKSMATENQTENNTEPITFNVDLDLKSKIQAAANKETEGNVSMWLRKTIRATVVQLGLES